MGTTTRVSVHYLPQRITETDTGLLPTLDSYILYTASMDELNILDHLLPRGFPELPGEDPIDATQK